MKLIVGLGNPGAKYAKNRHNIGFMAVDEIARAQGFGPWRSKFQGSLSEGVIEGEKVLLLKPETFMNLSGQSVGAAMRFYKLQPADVVVFHDELDLAAGKLRVKRGGGHAGHNGLRSLHQHVGGEYERVRLGIGHPGDKRLVSNYVLSDFAKSDADWLDPLLEAVGRAAPFLAKGQGDRFMTAVAQARQDAKPAPDAPEAVERKAETKAAPAPDNRSPLQKLLDKFN